jgi:hypothetical protein
MPSGNNGGNGNLQSIDKLKYQDKFIKRIAE